MRTHSITDATVIRVIAQLDDVVCGLIDPGPVEDDSSDTPLAVIEPNVTPVDVANVGVDDDDADNSDSDRVWRRYEPDSD